MFPVRYFRPSVTQFIRFFFDQTSSIALFSIDAAPPRWKSGERSKHGIQQAIRWIRSLLYDSYNYHNYM